MEVTLDDIKVVLMAIMRLNDGKTFVEADHAPLPQSEGEIGFRDKSGHFKLRLDELPRLHKHFDALYINQLQIYGRTIEQQRQQKLDEQIQKEHEEAKFKANQKSEKMAAKYRAKQIAEIESAVASQSEESNSQLAHVKMLSMQKAASDL